MTRDGAWLVAYLGSNGRYQLGIFSEQNPTVMGSVWTAQAMSGHGRDYSSARVDLINRIRQSLPIEIARHGDDEVRKAKGLPPRRRRPRRTVR